MYERKCKKVQRIKGEVTQAWGQSRKGMEMPLDLCIEVDEGN